MDSVQFQNSNVGVNEPQRTHIVSRNQQNAVQNPSASVSKNAEYRPASYNTAVTIRTNLTTKEEKKKYKELMEELVSPKYKRKLEYALKSGQLLKNNSNDTQYCL